MNDILFGNNNKAIIKKITKRELAADRKRNFFIIAAILLTAFMLTSVFSIGMSYYDTLAMREKRMQGSTSQMAFVRPTEEQLSKVYTLDYIDTVGIGASVATTDDVPGFSYLGISYVDQTQWEKMFCPTYSDLNMRTLELAQVDADDYFAHTIFEDLRPIIRDIREAHKTDTTTADITSPAEESLRQLEDVLSYEGSPEEKQARVLLAQLGIDYDAITKEEFVTLIGILNKSSHMKQKGEQSYKKERLEKQFYSNPRN